MEIFYAIGRILKAMPQSEATAVARQRLLLGAALAVAAFALIGLQIFSLASEDSGGTGWRGAIDTAEKRGRILDRKGRLLATTLPAYELYADPAEIMRAGADADKLAALLPDGDRDAIFEKLTRDARFAELSWKASPATYRAVLDAGIVGVYARKRHVRFYPQGQHAAHVIGFTDKDNNGIAGIEAGYDEKLKNGEDVHLAIDLEVQSLLRHAIATQMERFEAIGGAGVVMDMATGEIVALASLPGFDPNDPTAADDDARFNRATKGVYELGSMFKILNTAIALDSGAVLASDIIDVVSPLFVGRFRIQDYKPEKKPLTVAEVMVVSSNIGSARIAEQVGAQTQQSYLRALGMTEKLELDIPETARPLVPARWKRAEVMTIAYGHGLSVTPVHLASAIAVAAGDGIKRTPSLLKGGVAQPYETEIFRPEVTAQIRAIMRKVVTHKRGTGKQADAAGYIVGGKSGTAEKNSASGGYNENANIASFVAAFPLHAPRFVVLVMVDEPQPQDFSFNYATGGWVAAPAVGEFITAAAPLLGVLPADETRPDIAETLQVALPTLNREIRNASY